VRGQRRRIPSILFFPLPEIFWDSKIPPLDLWSYVFMLTHVHVYEYVAMRNDPTLALDTRCLVDASLALAMKNRDNSDFCAYFLYLFSNVLRSLIK
jgi:hypothetical protein